MQRSYLWKILYNVRGVLIDRSPKEESEEAAAARVVQTAYLAPRDLTAAIQLPFKALSYTTLLDMITYVLCIKTKMYEVKAAPLVILIYTYIKFLFNLGVRF